MVPAVFRPFAAGLPALLLTLALAVSACGGEDESEPYIPVWTGPEPTYHGQIKALLDEHCISCHASTKTGAQRKDAPTDVNYDSYAAAKANAREGMKEIRTGGMPNEGEKLAISDRSMFSAWVDAGMPEGTPGAGDTDSETESETDVAPESE